MTDYSSLIEVRLSELTLGETPLMNAMRYGLFPGGKRLRPKLLLAVCESVGGKVYPGAVDFACAVEMIHSYSLVHDDLPAMDDDDFRRGRPSCHRKFGEAEAILAGDALLNLAYETMANRLAGDTACAETYAKATCEIALAAGHGGMVGGQMSDIALEGLEADGAEIIKMIEGKTAALFAACVKAGAALGGYRGENVVLGEIGKKIGFAFQILDDIHDASYDQYGTAAVKNTAAKHKNTYVSAHGDAKAREDFKTLKSEALATIGSLQLKTGAFREMAEIILNEGF
ncbi:MAG: polyprenyl synthetase family protein [Defluviitaleaceae bacterium]|nr:polyprenyl synthetase family protein [Defluviitaleaceae bacterium]